MSVLWDIPPNCNQPTSHDKQIPDSSCCEKTVRVIGRSYIARNDFTHGLLLSSRLISIILVTVAKFVCKAPALAHFPLIQSSMNSNICKKNLISSEFFFFEKTSGSRIASKAHELHFDQFLPDLGKDPNRVNFTMDRTILSSRF